MLNSNHRDGLSKAAFLSLAGRALESAQDQIIWADAQGKIAYANRSACTALHYPGEALSWMRLGEIFPEITDEEWPHYWQELETAGHMALEVIQRSFTGKGTMLELSMTFLQHNHSRYAAIIGRDISDRMAAEFDLTEEKHNLESLFDNMQAGVLVLNPEGIITFANHRMARMLHAFHEDLIGSPYSQYVHPDERPVSAEWMRRLVEGEIDHFHHDRQYAGINGCNFRGHFCCRRMEDVRGNLISLVGVIAYLPAA
ncbi:PAS domain-containing protein [Geomonas sp. RF6]|uniref:PAS domain-containing protein n=1 Tax=Geomonas sp. RF6 TaxID=2897342 RepID=UPI001E3600C6|nr:PAS domain-containing protein [Geomonas sp. RF6]UFS71425.1 PAS domain-containing protein [Geomonas sp. RF6]